jgi:predicted PurR-regulated permease PerM
MPAIGPNPRQTRLLWTSLTGLSIGVLVGLIALVFLALGWIIQTLSGVLLPLAIAGILAYLLDPVVDALEKHRVPRQRAIFLVFGLAIVLVAFLLATIVPRLVVETGQLIAQLPAYAKNVQDKVEKWTEKSSLAMTLKKRVQGPMAGDLATKLQDWAARVAPIVWDWIGTQTTRLISWFGLFVGLALVPVYTFYLLLEKQGIAGNWTDYLPIHESRLKEELVFVIGAINGYLILFFRGQVLVALCDGVILTLGFLAIGMNYAFLLGMAAGLLSIVPFLGVLISLIPALALAAIQFNDWLHPVLVLAIFGLVQMAEGLYISPKIMGDRVGLHPLTIIIAVMVGTTLLGGIMGGILAIPLTAALRVLMFRYVWQRPQPASQTPLAV